MKVLHVFASLKYSGAEIMYVSAADEFKQKGCELYAMATKNELGEFSDQFIAAGFKVLHRPVPNTVIGRLIYIKNMIEFLKIEKIDVVHTHSSVLKVTMAFCAWFSGRKSIYTFHNVFPSNWYSYYYHILQRWAIKNIFNGRLQTISDSVYFHEKKYYKNNTLKVYNWYNSKRFYPRTNEEKKEIRKELNISNEDLVLISVGGCSHVKRHSEIIKALSLVKNKVSNIVYLHLGEGDDLADEINLAHELNLNKEIRFIGNTNDVEKYLTAADIYIMPSKFEGISITTIEALGCKKPSILYNVPGLKDFNNQYECSILIKEDYKILAENIILLWNNKDLQRKISDNGFRLVTENFDMKTNTQIIYELYQS